MQEAFKKQLNPKTANSLEDSAAEDMTHMDFSKKSVE